MRTCRSRSRHSLIQRIVVRPADRPRLTATPFFHPIRDKSLGLMIVHPSCWQCVCVGPRPDHHSEWAVWLGWLDPEAEPIPVDLILHTPVEYEVIALGKVTGKKLNLPVYQIDRVGVVKLIQPPSAVKASSGMLRGDSAGEA